VRSLYLDTGDQLKIAAGNSATSFYVSNASAFYPEPHNALSLGMDIRKWTFGYFSIGIGADSHIQIGTNPAQTGAIRLPNNTMLKFRNAANTADIDTLQVTAADVTMFTGPASFILRTNFPNQLMISDTGFWPNVTNNVDLGSSANRFRNIFISGAVVNRVKAGTPVDGDVNAPTDGMMILDSTANKIWVRLGGAWKGVVVA
jgi:hypothetical protein